MPRNTKKGYQILKELHTVSGQRHYHLAVFGDEIAKREGYKENTDIDAVHFYLMQKHNWLPSQVKSMSYEDLLFALSEEMSGWTLPVSARS